MAACDSKENGRKVSNERRQVLSQREREQRDRIKRLVGTIDSMLPPSFRSSAQRNGAGNRSLGGGGRALTDVLQDLLRYVSHHRQMWPQACIGAGAACSAASEAVSVSPDVIRESLLRARWLICVEVEMNVEQDWIICREGDGAARIWAAAPWGSSCVGHSLSQLVHRQGPFPGAQTTAMIECVQSDFCTAMIECVQTADFCTAMIECVQTADFCTVSPDFSALNSLWERTRAAVSEEGCAPEDSKDRLSVNQEEQSVSLRLVTFFHLATASAGCIPCCKYERYALRLHLCPPAIGVVDTSSGGQQHVLVVATPHTPVGDVVHGGAHLQGRTKSAGGSIKLQQDSLYAEAVDAQAEWAPQHAPHIECAAIGGEEGPAGQCHEPFMRKDPLPRCVTEVLSCAAMMSFNGMYELDKMSASNMTARGDTLLTPCHVREAVSDSNGVTSDELSFLQRLSGATWWCRQSLSGWTYRFLQAHFELFLEDNGVPRLRVHYRLRVRLPVGTFQTPWRVTANLRLDGTPCEYINGRSRNASGEYHMPILCLGDAAEHDAQQGAGQRSAEGAVPAPGNITIARFHCTPRSGGQAGAGGGRRCAPTVERATARGKLALPPTPYPLPPIPYPYTDRISKTLHADSPISTLNAQVKSNT